MCQGEPEWVPHYINITQSKWCAYFTSSLIFLIVTRLKSSQRLRKPSAANREFLNTEKATMVTDNKQITSVYIHTADRIFLVGTRTLYRNSSSFLSDAHLTAIASHTLHTYMHIHLTFCPTRACSGLISRTLEAMSNKEWLLFALLLVAAKRLISLNRDVRKP